MQLFRRMETRRLENADMQSLVRILRGVPFPCTHNDEAVYNKITKREIKSLPHKLRSLRPSTERGLRLCNTHKKLDHYLIKDIWSWMRHEFEGGIGRLLYPLIMCNALTPEQELRARQLEPVLQMWRADWKKELSPPPGRTPIETQNKWRAQHDGCPACMLARIGSDVNVLFALMAGMAGRMHRNPHKKIGYEDMNQFRGVTHKRIRFVRYWLMTYRFGERRAWEAWKFGREMKALRNKWKDGLFGEGAALLKDEYDFNKPIDRVGWSAAGAYDAKLGPQPRPLDVDPTTSAETVGLNVATWRDSVAQQTPLTAPSQLHISLRGDLDYTSISTHSRNDSFHDRRQASYGKTLRPGAPRPSSSIYSCRSGFGSSIIRNSSNNTYTSASLDQVNSNSFSDPDPASSHTLYSDPPTPHPHLSRNPYASPSSSSSSPQPRPRPRPPNPLTIPTKHTSRRPYLPPPRPQSLYGAYADASFDDDAFEHADTSPPMTPSREEWDRERDRIMGFGNRGDDRDGMDRESEVKSECTTWGDFCGK